MPKTLTIAVLLFASIKVFSQQKYLYRADIKSIEDDKVNVELMTPAIKKTK